MQLSRRTARATAGVIDVIGVYGLKNLFGNSTLREPWWKIGKPHHIYSDE